MIKNSTSSSVNKPKCLVIGSRCRGLVGYRGELLEEIVRRGFELTVASAEETDNDRRWFEDRGINFFPLRLLRTSLNPISDVRLCLEMIRLIRGLRPDACLFYNQKPVVFGTIAARIAGARNVNVLLAGLGYGFSGDRDLKSRFVQWILTMLHWANRNQAANFFFVNEEDLRLFQKLNLIGDATRSVLVPGEGVDVSKFFSQPWPTTGPIRVRCLTRLLEAKGVDDFAAASELVKRNFPETSFDLAGGYDSNPGRITPEQIQNWTDKGLINYLGHVEDVISLYQSSHILVLASRYREGFPNFLLEAMACGRPIVTYDNPGCSQAIIDPVEIEQGLSQGANGFLVERNNVPQLASAIQRLIQSPELRLKMGRQGNRIAVAHFNVHDVNAKILETIGVVPVQPTVDRTLAENDRIAGQRRV